MTLGPIRFADFEVPEVIRFGGRQRLAVHNMPGGGRVVDALGGEDSDLAWSGTFSGVDAVSRARLLDLLRAKGEPLPVAWDAFACSVVISRFEARFEHFNWIPYQISCVVLVDLPTIATASAGALIAATFADLGAASAYGAIGTNVAIAALAAAGGSLDGTAGAAVRSTLLEAAASTSSGLAAANSALDAASDVAGAASAAGQLAQIAAARGYVLRAQSNALNRGA